MPHATTSLETLVEAFTPAAITLLPSAPAARQLRHAYDAAQQARGLHTWEPAPILSWPQWLDHLWSEAVVSGIETRLLLNEAQEHALWLDVITARQTETTLSSADALADLAHQAWTLANAYNAADRLRAFANTHDTRTFATWAESFTQTCDRNAYISRATLEATLQHHIEAHTLEAPPTLTLVGFTNLTPSQSALLETLRNGGVTIIEQTLEATQTPNPTRSVHTALTEPEELRTLATWLRTFLQQRQQSNQTSTVCVLLTDPDDAPNLEATFREILAPELQSITTDLSSTPWEFVSGTPLTAQPLISIALDLAHWAQSPLDLNKVSALLLSPYLGNSTEHDTSARFDANVVRKARLLRPELNLRTLLRLAQTSPDTPTWLQPLHQFLTATGNLETPRTFADWSELLRSLIATTNWPNNTDARPLTSLEFQATQAWDSVLDQLATLDFRGRRVPYSTFLHTLDRQVSSAAFTPPANNAPIQILTPSAALGLTFDALILTRATDTNYPAAERTNPLLGFGLQAALDMPGTSQPHATERAHQAFTQILASSPNILFTYTPETADGEQRLSPLIANLNLPELPQPLSEPTTPIAEDILEDTTPLPALTSPHVQGGARVLQLQAACGFQAFAEIRLHASELDTKDLGFDALESGNFLHRTMDKFWEHIESHHALSQLSAEARTNTLSNAIDTAIDRNLNPENNWDKAYIDLQKERLLNLLQHWIDLELKREPFRVAARETKQLIHIGPLELTVRLDRLDAVKDGFFLVDYKTGYAANPSNWDSDRPDDPQLPLYSLLHESGELHGLAFAKIRPGRDMKWLGYQDEPGIIPGKNVVDLETRLSDWHTTLTVLAENFASGDASVNPKDYPTTCTHCAQRLLCRLNPQALLIAGNDSEDPDNESEAQSNG
jgi:ATP-dependent helicase/nuclease subunit B